MDLNPAAQKESNVIKRLAAIFIAAVFLLSLIAVTVGIIAGTQVAMVAGMFGILITGSWELISLLKKALKPHQRE